MARQAFQQVQYDFAAHLRNPDTNDAPTDVEDRRMKIYRDLIYNNINSFIESGFPVLRTLYSDDAWHKMVRDFVHRHQSHSPYFLEISQEFLKYLQEERAEESDPVFLLELAHYEWVELALNVSTEQLPANQAVSADVLAQNVLKVSPLAWRLSYQYPVHKISESYQPTEPPEQPTFLVVYRDRADKVQFMEANGVTMRLLQLLEGDAGMTGDAALSQIAIELNHPQPEQVISSGHALLNQLASLDIISPA